MLSRAGGRCAEAGTLTLKPALPLCSLRRGAVPTWGRGGWTLPTPPASELPCMGRSFLSGPSAELPRSTL